MLRRDFTLALSSFFLLPTNPAFSKEEEARTVFSIIWRDINIGYSKIYVEKKKQTLFTHIDVLINVKLFGLNLFNYKLKCIEEWREKRLISISSNCKSNNETFYVNGQIFKNGFKINGSGFKGVVNGEVATTSYFTPDFLDRKIWISTQDGTPLKIKSKLISNEKISILEKTLNVKKFEIVGDLELDLIYSSENEWVGSKFDAGGSEVTFVMKEKKGNIHNIWKDL